MSKGAAGTVESRSITHVIKPRLIRDVPKISNEELPIGQSTKGSYSRHD